MIYSTELQSIMMQVLCKNYCTYVIIYVYLRKIFLTHLLFIDVRCLTYFMSDKIFRYIRYHACNRYLIFLKVSKVFVSISYAIIIFIAQQTRTDQQFHLQHIVVDNFFVFLDMQNTICHWTLETNAFH